MITLEKIGLTYCNRYIEENYKNEELMSTYDIKEIDQELYYMLLKDLKNENEFLISKILFKTYSQNDPHRKYPIYYFYKKDFEEFKKLKENKTLINIRFTINNKYEKYIKEKFYEEILKIYPNDHNTFRIYFNVETDINKIEEILKLLNKDYK